MVCGARALLPTSNVERRGKRIPLPRGRTDFKSIGSRRRFRDPALAHRGAGVLGKVLSRTVRKFLNEQELLFPAPLMKLNGRERDIPILAAAGRASKEIAAMVGVDMHVGPILSKMGALNRNQAIAKAITNKLIDVDDDGHAEYMSAKLNATRKKSVPIARSAAGTDRGEAR